MRRNGLSCGALSEVLSTTRRARLGLRELERLVLSKAEGCPPDSRQGWRSSGTLAMVLLFGICCVNVYAAGQTEKVLYRFQGGKDGTTPIGGLVEDAAGNLYGTTDNGGPSDYGTVFQLSPPKTSGGAWNETVLHAFKFRSDGNHPIGALILDEAGNLYGTTSSGGLLSQCYGCGTVFELVRPDTPGGAWTEKILHSFDGTDGVGPFAGLVRGEDGHLYGTTPGGGATGYGTVFELIPPDDDHNGAWTERVLYSFTGGVDGWFPTDPVVRGPDGALYGTTGLGGVNALGNVYRLAPPDSEGGSWSLSVIYSFKGGSDGEIPGGGVVFDRQGRLYGGTANGGNPIFCNSGCGVVFQLTRPSSGSGAWSEETLHEFNGDDGAQAGGLIFGSSGSLYGVTANGGPVSLTCPGDCGSVYQLTPPASPRGKWRQTTLYFFTSAGDGHNPNPGLIRDPAGALFGVTPIGGNSIEGGIGGGTVFEILP